MKIVIIKRINIAYKYIYILLLLNIEILEIIYLELTSYREYIHIH